VEMETSGSQNFDLMRNFKEIIVLSGWFDGADHESELRLPSNSLSTAQRPTYLHVVTWKATGAPKMQLSLVKFKKRKYVIQKNQ
jgi:hypothetical protein